MIAKSPSNLVLELPIPGQKHLSVLSKVSLIGLSFVWVVALTQFTANDLLQLRIGQQGGNGIKTFQVLEKEVMIVSWTWPLSYFTFTQLTKNIKDCFSWKGSIANKVTLNTLNPSTKLSLVFQTKEAEDTVGGLLKKIQYSQSKYSAGSCSPAETAR